MKFLVALALFVCAANAAAVFPWQQGGVSAVATASVAPQVARTFVAQPVVAAAKAVSNVQPSVQTYQPIASAKAISSIQPTQTYEPVQATFKNVGNVKDVEAAVLRSETDVAADGFNYVFEASNGIAAQAQGTLKKVNDGEGISIQGSYQYVSPDGTPVVFRYIADENGYQPQSELIPTPPPVPVAILRSLEWIASQPKQVEYKKL